MTKRAIAICAAIAAGALGWGLWLSPQLPEKMPRHWNAAGEVDGWGSKTGAIWMVPIIMLGLVALLAFLPRLSPKNKDVAPFQKAYDAAAIAITAFMALVHAATLQAALGPVDMNKFIMTGLGALFIVIGNILGKVTRNYWMGIRTPWTLESDVVWERTHRLAGWTTVAGGVVCVVFGLLTPWPWVGFAVAMAGILIPVPYSYMVYRRVQTNDGRLQA